jgi:U1 small nuclear ribonucleoprotein C
MPKFYCDYCDIFLTHDSMRVRNDHNAGWKHKMHLQNYYSGLDQMDVQVCVDRITQAYWEVGLPGFPELVAMGPRGRPRPQLLPNNTMAPITHFPIPSFRPPVPGFRPPMLPMPGFKRIAETADNISKKTKI